MRIYLVYLDVDLNAHFIIVQSQFEPILSSEHYIHLSSYPSKSQATLELEFLEVEKTFKKIKFVEFSA